MPGVRATVNGPASIGRHAQRIQRLEGAIAKAEAAKDTARVAALTAERERRAQTLVDAKAELEAALETLEKL